MEKIYIHQTQVHSSTLISRACFLPQIIFKSVFIFGMFFNIGLSADDNTEKSENGAIKKVKGLWSALCNPEKNGWNVTSQRINGLRSNTKKSNQSAAIDTSMVQSEQGSDVLSESQQSAEEIKGVVLDTQALTDEATGVSVDSDVSDSNTGLSVDQNISDVVVQEPIVVLQTNEVATQTAEQENVERLKQQCGDLAKALEETQAQRDFQQKVLDEKDNAIAAYQAITLKEQQERERANLQYEEELQRAARALQEKEEVRQIAAQKYQDELDKVQVQRDLQQKALVEKDNAITAYQATNLKEQQEREQEKLQYQEELQRASRALQEKEEVRQIAAQKYQDELDKAQAECAAKVKIIEDEKKRHRLLTLSDITKGLNNGVEAIRQKLVEEQPVESSLDLVPKSEIIQSQESKIEETLTDELPQTTITLPNLEATDPLKTPEIVTPDSAILDNKDTDVALLLSSNSDAVDVDTVKIVLNPETVSPQEDVSLEDELVKRSIGQAFDKDTDLAPTDHESVQVGESDVNPDNLEKESIEQQSANKDVALEPADDNSKVIDQADKADKVEQVDKSVQFDANLGLQGTKNIQADDEQMSLTTLGLAAFGIVGVSVLVYKVYQHWLMTHANAAQLIKSVLQKATEQDCIDATVRISSWAGITLKDGVKATVTTAQFEKLIIKIDGVKTVKSKKMLYVMMLLMLDLSEKSTKRIVAKLALL